MDLFLWEYEYFTMVLFRKATSDWMEIEKARGISVTSTVLSFEYELGNYKWMIFDICR
jgi:peptide subunit release factor RF-3